MKYLLLLLFVFACGIKGDPVPPTDTTDWYPPLKDKEKKDENI